MAITDKVITYKAENKILKFVTIGLIALLSITTIVMSVLFIVVPRGGGSLTNVERIVFEKTAVDMTVNSEEYITYGILPDTATNTDIEFIGRTTDGNYLVGQDILASVSTVQETQTDGTVFNRIKIKTFGIEGKFVIKLKSKQRVNLTYDIPVTIVRKFVDTLELIESPAIPRQIDNLMFLKKQGETDIEARKFYIKVTPADATELTINATVTDNDGNKVPGLVVDTKSRVPARDNAGKIIPGVYTIPTVTTLSGFFRINLSTVTAEGGTQTKNIPVRIFDAIHSVEYKSDGGKTILEVGKGKSVNIKDVININVKNQNGVAEPVPPSQMDSIMDGLKFDTAEVLVVDKPQLVGSKIITAAPAFTGVQSYADAVVTATSSFENGKQLGTFTVRIKVPVTTLEIDKNNYTYYLKREAGQDTAMIKALLSSPYTAPPYNMRAEFKINKVYKDGRDVTASKSESDKVIKLEPINNNECKVTALSYGMAEIAVTSADNPDIEARIVKIYIKELGISLNGGATFENGNATSLYYQVNTVKELKDIIYVRSHETAASVTALNKRNPSINIAFSAEGSGKSDFNKAQCAINSSVALEDTVNVKISLTADAGTGEWGTISNTLNFDVTKYDFVSEIKMDAKSGDTFYYSETGGKATYTYYVGNTEMGGQMYRLSDFVSLKMTSGLGVPAKQRVLKYTSGPAVSVKRLEISPGVFADCIVINSFSETPVEITIELSEKRPGPASGINGDTAAKLTFSVVMIRKITDSAAVSIGAMKDSANIVSFKNNKQEYIVADNKTYSVGLDLGFTTTKRDMYKFVSNKPDMARVELNADGTYYIHTGDAKKKDASDPNLVTLSLWGMRIINLNPVEYYIKDILVRVTTDVSTMSVSMQGRTDSDVTPYKLKINGDYNQDNSGIVVNFRGETAPLDYRDFPLDMAVSTESEDNAAVSALFGAKGFEIVPLEEGKTVFIKFYFDSDYKYAVSGAPETEIDGDIVRTIYIQTESAVVYTYQYDDEIEQGGSTSVKVSGTTGGAAKSFTYRLDPGAGNSNAVSFSTTPDQTTAVNDIITARVLSSASERTVHIIVTIIEEDKEDEPLKRDIYIKIMPITVSFVKSGTPDGVNTIKPNRPGINDADNTIIFTSEIANRNSNVDFEVAYKYSNANIITPTVDDSVNNKSVLTIKGKPGLIGGNVQLTAEYIFTLKSDRSCQYKTVKTYEFTVEGINPDIKFFVNSETTESTGCEVKAGTTDFLLYAKVGMYPVDKFDWKFRITSDTNNLMDGTSFEQGGNATDGIYGEFGVSFKLDAKSGGTVAIEAVLEFDGMSFASYFTVTVLPLSVELKLTNKPTGETPGDGDMFDSVTLNAGDTVRVLGVNKAGNGVPVLSYTADRTDLVTVAADGTVTAKKGTFGGAVRITATTPGGAAFGIDIDVLAITADQFTAAAKVNNGTAAITVKQGENVTLGWSLTHSDSAYTDMINAPDGFSANVEYTYSGLLGAISGVTFTAAKTGLGGSLIADARITLTDKTGAVLVFDVKTPVITVKELDLTVKSDKNDIPQGGTANFETDIAKLNASSVNGLEKLEIAEIVQGNTLIATKSVDIHNKAIVTVKTGAIGGAIEIKFKVTVASTVFYRNVTVNVIAKTIDFNFKAYKDSAMNTEFSGTLLQGGTVYFDVVSKLDSTDISEDSVSFTSGNPLFVKDSAESNKFTAQTGWVGGAVSVQAKVTIDGIVYYLTYNIDIQVVRPDNITLGITAGGGAPFNPATDVLAQGGSRLNFSVIPDSYITASNQAKEPVYKVISGAKFADFDRVNKAMLLSKPVSGGGDVVIEVTVYPDKQIFSYIVTIKVAALNLTFVSGSLSVDQGSAIDNYINVSAGSVTVNDTENMTVTVLEGAELINGVSFHNQNGVQLIYKYKTLNSFGGALRVLFTVKESKAANAEIWAVLEVGVTIKGATVDVTNKNLSYVVDQGAEQAYDFGFNVPTGFTASTELLSTTGAITVDNTAKKVTADITGNTAASYGVAVFKTKITSRNYPAAYKEIETVLRITVQPLVLTITGIADPTNLLQNTVYNGLNYSLTGIAAGKVTATAFSLSNNTLADITSAGVPGAFKTKHGTLGGEVGLILTLTLNGGAAVTASIPMRVNPIAKFDFTVTPASDTALSAGNTYAVTVNEATLGAITVTSVETVSIGGGFIVESISGNNIDIKGDTLGGVVTLKITIKVLGIEQYIYHEIFVTETEPTITFTADGGALDATLYYDSGFVLAPAAGGHTVSGSSSFALLDSSYGTVTNNGDGTATLSIGGADKRLADKNLVLNMRLVIDGREYYKTLIFRIEGIKYAYNGAADINHGGTLTMSYNIVNGYKTVTAVPADKVSYSLVPTDLGTLTGNVFTAKNNIRSGEVKINVSIDFHSGSPYTETLTVAVNGVTPVFKVIDKNNADSEILDGAYYNQGVAIKPELTETAITGADKRFTGFTVTEGTSLAVKKELSAGVYGLTFLSNTNGGKVVLKLTYEIDGVGYDVNLSLNVNKTAMLPSFDAGTDILDGKDVFSVDVDVTGVDSALVSYDFKVSGDIRLYGDDLRVTGNNAELTAAESFTGGDLYLMITVTINNVDTGFETYSRIIKLTVNAISGVKAQVSGGVEGSVYDSNEAVVLELAGIDGLTVGNVTYRTAGGVVISSVSAAPFRADYTLPVMTGTGVTVHNLEAVITLAGGESTILPFSVSVNNIGLTATVEDDTPISHDGGTKNFTVEVTGLSGAYDIGFEIVKKNTATDAAKYGSVTGSAGVYVFTAAYGSPDIEISVIPYIIMAGETVCKATVTADITITGIAPVITFADKEFDASKAVMFESEIAGVDVSAYQVAYAITEGLDTLVNEEKDVNGNVVGMSVVPGVKSGIVTVQVTYTINGDTYTELAEFTIRSLELAITDGNAEIAEIFAGGNITLNASSDVAGVSFNYSFDRAGMNPVSGASVTVQTPYSGTDYMLTITVTTDRTASGLVLTYVKMIKVKGAAPVLTATADSGSYFENGVLFKGDKVKFGFEFPVAAAGYTATTTAAVAEGASFVSVTPDGSGAVTVEGLGAGSVSIIFKCVVRDLTDNIVDSFFTDYELTVAEITLRVTPETAGEFDNDILFKGGKASFAYELSSLPADYTISTYYVADGVDSYISISALTSGFMTEAVADGIAGYVTVTIKGTVSYNGVDIVNVSKDYTFYVLDPALLKFDNVTLLAETQYVMGTDIAVSKDIIEDAAFNMLMSEIKYTVVGTPAGISETKLPDKEELISFTTGDGVSQTPSITIKAALRGWSKETVFTTI